MSYFTNYDNLFAFFPVPKNSSNSKDLKEIQKHFINHFDKFSTIKNPNDHIKELMTSKQDNIIPVTRTDLKMHLKNISKLKEEVIVNDFTFSEVRVIRCPCIKMFLKKNDPVEITTEDNFNSHCAKCVEKINLNPPSSRDELIKRFFEIFCDSKSKE